MFGVSQNALGSIYVVEQLLFSIVPSILIFDFDVNLGSFFTFWALIDYIWVWVGCKNCFVVSSQFCSIFALSCRFEFLWWVGVPSDYFVSTQLQLSQFCCWGCACYWAVTIHFIRPYLLSFSPYLQPALHCLFFAVRCNCSYCFSSFAVYFQPQQQHTGTQLSFLAFGVWRQFIC